MLTNFPYWRLLGMAQLILFTYTLKVLIPPETLSWSLSLVMLGLLPFVWAWLTRPPLATSLLAFTQSLLMILFVGQNQPLLIASLLTLLGWCVLFFLWRTE